MSKTVLAVGAHPDDIEFMMAGTLLRLAERGYKPHVFVVGSGSCGSMTTTKEETVRIRLLEARNAAKMLNAVFHQPVADDLEVVYSLPLLRKVATVIRRVQPDIILTHSPQEYMEDHMATCRLTVTAAFSRGMPNFDTDPPIPAYTKDVVLYHCLPYGLCDQLGTTVTADLFVDVEDLLDAKACALACHESQKLWLDKSQGLDSYLQTMRDMCGEMGRMSGVFGAAEGWRFHSNLGFCPPGSNPLAAALAEKCLLVDGK